MALLGCLVTTGTGLAQTIPCQLYEGGLEPITGIATPHRDRLYALGMTAHGAVIDMGHSLFHLPSFQAPAFTDSICFDAFIQGMVTDPVGEHAYLITSDDSLRVVSVTEEGMALETSMPLPLAGDRMAVDEGGGRLVIANADSAVVYDIGDPHHPVRGQVFPIQTTTYRAVAVEDSLVFVAEQHHVAVYDTADPLAPRHLADVPAYSVERLAADARQLFVLSWEEHFAFPWSWYSLDFEVFDLSDPTDPQSVAQRSLARLSPPNHHVTIVPGSQWVALMISTKFLVMERDGLRIIGKTRTGSYGKGVAWQEDLFLCADEDTLLVRKLHRAPLVMPAVSIEMQDNEVYAGGETWDIRITSLWGNDGCYAFCDRFVYDISDPFQPVQIARYGTYNFDHWYPECSVRQVGPRRFFVEKTRHEDDLPTAVLTEVRDDGELRFALSHPGYRLLRWAISERYAWTLHDPWWRKADGDTEETYLYDITDITQAHELPMPAGMTVPWVVLGSLAVQAVGDTATLIDAGRPGGPVLRGSFPLHHHNSSPRPVLVGDLLCFMEENYTRLVRVDCRDPDHPVRLPDMAVAPEVNDMVTYLQPVGDWLCLCLRSGFVLVDPFAGVLLTPRLGQDGHTYRPLRHGHLLYVPWSGGMDLYDVSVPGEPVFLGQSPVSGGNLATNGRWLVCGMDILPLDCRDPLPVSPPPGEESPPDLPTRLALTGRPNPFNPRTELRFDLPRPGRVTVAVYDVAGRLVRTLVDGRRSAGRHTVTWDGRDAAGREVPAGVYFARLAADGRTEVRKLALVR